MIAFAIFKEFFRKFGALKSFTDEENIPQQRYQNFIEISDGSYLCIYMYISYGDGSGKFESLNL
jgi:hypothetical protein